MQLITLLDESTLKTTKLIVNEGPKLKRLSPLEAVFLALKPYSHVVHLIKELHGSKG